jgi:N-acylneuraminate cytidylyltransferase
MLDYPIRAAIEAGCFEEVMVSTDDDEIAETARRAGAVTPFMRSSKNARDDATTTSAVLEVLSQYRAAGREFDSVCVLYAASPLIRAQHLRQGRDLMLANPLTATVMPVVRFSHPVQRAFSISRDLLRMVAPEHEFTRSQDLAPRYHDAGQWYWLRAAAFERAGRIFGDECVPLILSELDVQDMDNEDDWKLAELKLRLRDKDAPA